MEIIPRNQSVQANESSVNFSKEIYHEVSKSVSSKLGIIILLSVLISSEVYAQALPQGFVKVQVTNGLTNPTAMAVAPDGRIFVTQQNGIVKVIKNGSLLTTPFVQINVHAVGERGLIGIALDPGFSTNQYVYLYYTLPDGSRNRISRFTGNGNIAIAGSEKIVLNLDPLSSATNHNGGAIHFGPDGKLYVGIGDNANASNAQNLDTYHGKLLRINSDGSIPAGNPFSGSPQKSRIWAYGLRNPFTLDIQPGTGRIFVNDVGQITWEEINDATVAGKNFGWPLAEGNSANTALTNPIYSYAHGSGDGKGCAIAGSVFFNPVNTNYPAEYWGDYFFLDLCNQWINFLNLSGSTATRMSFATSLGSGLVYLDVGIDGNIYYLQRSTSSLNKIIYTNNTAPAIKLEAESAQLTGPAVASNHAGYSGNGFADYRNASGDQIEWVVNAASAGSYELSFRYALAQGTRNLQIQVNGVTVNTALSFAATGNWSGWSNRDLSVNLNAGVNRIKAIAIGTSGPNMDYVVVTPQTLQAEQAILSGARVASNNSGFTGSGFGDYINSTGDYVEWVVYKATAGPVALNFRYANGSTANRPLQMQVNGVVISPGLAFPPTGGWTQWSNVAVNVNLVSGRNRVRLTATGSSGANIDYLRWSAATSSTAMQAKVEAGNMMAASQETEVALSVEASPNPASEMVRLQISKTTELPVKVSIVNASGKVYQRLLIKNSEPANLNLSLKGLPSGLYVVIVEQGNKSASTRLIKN